MKWYFELKINAKIIIGIITVSIISVIFGIAGGALVSENTTILSVQSTGVLLLMLLSAILVSTLLGILLSRNIRRPLKMINAAMDKLSVGEIQIELDIKPKDEMGDLITSMEKMVDYIKVKAEFANKVALGVPNIESEVAGCKDPLSEGLGNIIKTIDHIVTEIMSIANEHNAGEIDVFIPEEKFAGVFQIVAKGINDMVKGHIDVKKKAMACVAEFAKGNFNAELEKFPGKKAFINDNIEALRRNLKEVNSEINKLIAASHEGRLSDRASAQLFEGDWAVLIRGLNGLIDAILEPIQEAADVLEEMSRGNLQASVKGNYKGDHAKIKHALNDSISTLSSYVNEISSILTEMANGNLNVGITREYRGDFEEIKVSLNHISDTFNEMINEINMAAAQVASGSRQLSDSSMALSQGATEQASSIEELTASIEQISSQTKQNADNAGDANNLAKEAKINAAHGNDQMKEMLKSMEDISDASSSISKIIKVIDDIAFQTNILALNAAVEAARAGQHGKGFAVVAEEVRNLAARSANAAKETTDIIEGSMDKIVGGTNIANQTAGELNKIVDVVSKVAGLVESIATASNEQAAGLEQINQGVIQISKVVQTNSATSEESASASEELASQAEMLNMQVAKFKLKKVNSTVDSYKGMQSLNENVLNKLNNLTVNKDEIPSKDNMPSKPNKIALSDVEFGKYSMV